MTLRAPDVRFPIEPAFLPPEKVARWLHRTPAQFAEDLPKLRELGFPAPNPVTGNYDIDALRLWKRGDNPKLYGLTGQSTKSDSAPSNPVGSMGDRFAATKRGGHGRAA